LFIAISFRLLEWWYWEWTKPESFYGHAFFVPVLAGVMFWHLRDKLAAVPKERSYSALLLFLPAVAMLVVANHRALLSLSSPLFIFALITGVAFVVGWKFVRVAAFPFLFLTLMLPLPGTLLNDLTLGIQGASTAGATKILNTIGIHSLRQGNIISMDNYVMNVATACSGFNLLLRLLTFSAAFAYLTDGAALRRIGLFLFSLPLSVAINAIRIAMIGIVGECLGSTAASTFAAVVSITTFAAATTLSITSDGTASTSTTTLAAAPSMNCTRTASVRLASNGVCHLLHTSLLSM
jgi:exosortase